ncbi:MAG TPA: cupredoxin domain-containing protein [Pyrinomonadaceae bacterium]|nr:cupredoxin domain-containing protein [Pyrinomonadaceae bacterium]
MHRKKRVLIAGFIFVSAMITSGLAIYVRANALPTEREIHITAKKFEFTPDTITVKKGESVVLVVSSQDRKHGFNLRAFGIRADIDPGATARIRFTPNKTGKFTFSCDVFCGEGHEDMTGTIIVTE